MGNLKLGRTFTNDAAAAARPCSWLEDFVEDVEMPHDGCRLRSGQRRGLSGPIFSRGYENSIKWCSTSMVPPAPAKRSRVARKQSARICGALIGEEAISRLGAGAVLARQRDTLRRAFGKLLQQSMDALDQTPVLELATQRHDPSISDRRAVPLL